MILALLAVIGVFILVPYLKGGSLASEESKQALRSLKCLLYKKYKQRNATEEMRMMFILLFSLQKFINVLGKLLKG